MAAQRNQLDSTLDRMDYGRALKGELVINSKPESWVPYAQPLLDAGGTVEGRLRHFADCPKHGDR